MNSFPFLKKQRLNNDNNNNKNEEYEEDDLINDIIEDDSEKQDDFDVKLIVNNKEIKDNENKSKFIKDLEEILNNFLKKYNLEIEQLKKENLQLKQKLSKLQSILNN